jgi:hypothetical protein
VTHNPSRKEFLPKLLGVTAVFSFFPKLFARSAAEGVAGSATPEVGSTTAPFVVRPDARAVARDPDTI